VPDRGHCEEPAGAAAHIQHGCYPFERAALLTNDRNPATADCIVDPVACGEGNVEPAGKGGRGIVADGELHGGHGADAAAHQRGSRPGKQIDIAGFTA
jgi:hypothetical protein